MSKKDEIKLLKYWRDKSCWVAMVKIGYGKPFRTTVADSTDNRFITKERIERLISGRLTSPVINH